MKQSIPSWIQRNGLRRFLPIVFSLAVLCAACGATTPERSASSVTSQDLGPSVVVSYIQSALTRLNYLDEVTGVFDAHSQASLAKFQRSRGLPATGQFDAATALALAKASPETQKYAVMALQTELTELGVFHGTIDGTYGTATKEAIRQLQAKAGIRVDGVVGPATLSALDRQYRSDVVDPEKAADHYFPRTTTIASSPASSTSTTLAKPTPSSPSPSEIAQVQARLTQLGYLPGPIDGKPSVQTSSAVLAFQKRNGLTRDGVIGPQVLSHLNGPQGAGPRSSGPGPRVEIDLDRQILFYVAADGAVTTINTSTGSGATYREPGGATAVAYTPTGTYTVLRKINALEKAPLGTLYHPMYFYKGWAIHGSPNVPAYPASHGCARVANWDEDYLYSRMPIGAQVWVYGKTLGSVKDAQPGF